MKQKVETVKWKSALFPQLVLTEEHYQVMRRIYPYIDSFQREMERLEGWLYVNPLKQPRRNWKNQINNWMKIADQIAQRERQRRLVRGQERPVTHREAAESIGTIFQRLAEEGSADSEPTGGPRSLFDALGRPHSGSTRK